MSSKYSLSPEHHNKSNQKLSTYNFRKIDLVGFSFGGRVAACIAAYHPDLINKLSLTGVPFIRPALGKVIITSWADLLAKNNVRDCAWSFLINGYSPAFIEKYESKLHDYVDAIVEANDPRKLYDLISQSQSPSSAPLQDEDPFSVSYCATKIKCPTQVFIMDVMEIFKLYVHTNTHTNI